MVWGPRRRFRAERATLGPQGAKWPLWGPRGPFGHVRILGPMAGAGCRCFVMALRALND